MLSPSSETSEGLGVNYTKNLHSEHSTRVWIEKLERRKPERTLGGAIQVVQWYVWYKACLV